LLEKCMLLARSMMLICRERVGRMPRKRGNPNWCTAGPVMVPHIVTEFEIQVRQLRLEVTDYAASAQLREWCVRNKDRRYVPEWLLDAWDMTVDVHYNNMPWSHIHLA